MLSACVVKMFFNRVVAPVFLKRVGDEAVAERAEREELPPILDYLEREMEGREFLVGEKVTLADIALRLASPIWNMLASRSHQKLGLP